MAEKPLQRELERLTSALCPPPSRPKGALHPITTRHLLRLAPNTDGRWQKPLQTPLPTPAAICKTEDRNAGRPGALMQEGEWWNSRPRQTAVGRKGLPHLSAPLLSLTTGLWRARQARAECLAALQLPPLPTAHWVHPLHLHPSLPARSTQTGKARSPGQGCLEGARGPHVLLPEGVFRIQVWARTSGTENTVAQPQARPSSTQETTMAPQCAQDRVGLLQSAPS